MMIKSFKQKLVYIVLWIIIPLVLVVGGLAISLLQLHRQQIGLLTLTRDYPASLFEVITKDELLANRKISGKFIASDNYLGILSIRFETHLRINDDWLIFRIKEMSEGDWYYQNKYKVDQFQPNQLFPFGFPVIDNSEGREYLFEIESTQGERDNAISIDPSYPAFQARYKYPKEIIFSELNSLNTFIKKKIDSLKSEGVGKSIKNLPGFIRNIIYSENENIKISLDTTTKFTKRKLLNLVTDIEFSVSSLFYLTPAVLYILWIASIRAIKYKPYIFVLIPPVLMAVESILLKSSYDVILLGITSLWVLILFYYKLDSTVSWILSVTFLITASALLYLGFDLVAEKYGSWVLITLITGILSQIYEYVYSVKLYSISDYLRLLLIEFRIAKTPK